MRLKKYMVNEMSIPSWITNSFNKVKKELSKMTFSEFNKKCEKAFDELVSIIDPEELSAFLKKVGIDEHTFKNKLFKESIEINEDMSHWWNMIKTEAFPTLAFYPALQVWLELDKILKGTPYSGAVIAFYASFWLLLISGKYISGWLKWKKENPEEYNKEHGIVAGAV